MRGVKGEIRKEKKKIFEVIMAENCLKFIRDTKNHTSRKFRHNKKDKDQKMYTYTYCTQMRKNQRQREILERSQREMEIYQNRGTMIRIILDFLFSEIMQARKA